MTKDFIWVCDVCNGECMDCDVLVGEHPFRPWETVVGCPYCKEIGSLYEGCFE